jgi:hypothetical protein
MLHSEGFLRMICNAIKYYYNHVHEIWPVQQHKSLRCKLSLKTLLCDVTMIHTSGKYVTIAIEPHFCDWDVGWNWCHIHESDVLSGGLLFVLKSFGLTSFLQAEMYLEI